MPPIVNAEPTLNPALQGCVELDLANATKVPSRVDRDTALVVVLVLVIENPGQRIDYEHDDDD